MERKTDAVVLGGGISGLTSAFLLALSGVDVVVMEASERPGGCITTWSKDGWLFELGPNTVLNNAHEIDRLCTMTGVLEDRIGSPRTGKIRYIAKKGRLVRLPGGPLSFLTTPLFSFPSKLGLLREPFIKPAPPDREETIAEFTQRRLGGDLLNYAVGPFVSGVYAGDPARLSVKHATGKIYNLEQQHGSLIRGAFAKKKGPAPAGGLFTFRKGLASLPDALAGALGNGYLGGTQALSVQRDDGGYIVEAQQDGTRWAVHARAVISALPAVPASNVFKPMDSGFSGTIRKLPYANVATVCLGVKRSDVAHSLEGFGFLVPEVERRHILGCLFTSSLFPGRAPEGFAALTIYLGGAMHPERVEDEDTVVLEKTLNDLQTFIGYKGEPVIARVERWRPAIPQYNMGHGLFKESAAGVETANPGVFISGNLLNGVSVGYCIQNGWDVGRRAAEYLGVRSFPSAVPARGS